VREPPAKMPKGSAVVVTFDATELKSGPWSVSVPGAATVPDRFNSRAEVVALVKGSSPPRLTVLLVSWIRGSGAVLAKFDRTMESKLKRALIVLPLELSSGPAKLTFAGAVTGPLMLLSETPKKLPPDCASGPELKVDPVNWMSGAVVVLVSSAACLTPNASQQADPCPRLVVLKMLPLTAENRGPARVSLVGVVVDSDRRKLKMLAELSTLELLKARSAAAPLLVTLLLSPMNRNEKMLLAGFPLRRTALGADSSGPARLTVGGSPRLDATVMKLLPAPETAARAEPPLIETSAF
jgi:hypothetical protein